MLFMSYYQCCYKTSHFSSYYSTDFWSETIPAHPLHGQLFKSRTEPPSPSSWSASFEVLRRVRNKGGIIIVCKKKKKKQIGKREVNERHKEKKSAEMLRLKWRDETPYLPPPPHLLAGQRGGVSFKRGRKVISHPPPPNHTHTHTQFPLSLLSFHLFF